LIVGVSFNPSMHETIFELLEKCSKLNNVKTLINFIILLLFVTVQSQTRGAMDQSKKENTTI